MSRGIKDTRYSHSGDGQTLRKDDSLFEAIGSIDELNAHLGLAISELDKDDYKKTLSESQIVLTKIMSEFAFAPKKDETIQRADAIGLDSPEENQKKQNHNDLLNYVETLTEETERLKTSAGAVKTFIQPGKNRISAFLHIARTVCRRAERRAVSMQQHRDISSESLAYLNKLSEYLFYLACVTEKEE